MYKALEISLRPFSTLLVAALLLCACGRGDSSANRLFGEAYQLARQAEATTNASERADLLSRALAILDDIEVGFPNSAAARRLSSGEAIGGISRKNLALSKIEAAAKLISGEDLIVVQGPSPAASSSGQPSPSPLSLPTASPAPATPSEVEAEMSASAAEAQLIGTESADYESYKQQAHFRAFATTDPDWSPSSWASSKGTPYVADAVSEALERCEAARQARAVNPPCRLFAIGDIVVYGMSSARQEMAERLYSIDRHATNDDMPKLGQPSVTTDVQSRMGLDLRAGFLKYQQFGHYRAFATTDIDASPHQWGSSSGNITVDQAVSESLLHCESFRQQRSVLSRCRPLAIGDIIVYDMSNVERQVAKNAYAANQNATNSDWASIWQRSLPQEIVECSTAPSVDCLMSLSLRNATIRQRVDQKVGIFEALEKGGHSAEASAWLKDALFEASNIDDVEVGDRALLQLVVAQAEAGDLSGATEVATRFKSSYWRNEAWAVLAVGQVKIGNLGEGIKIASLVSGADRQNQVHVSIVEVLARQGKTLSYYDLASGIHDPRRRAEAYAAIVKVRAESGDPKGALLTTEIIADPYWKQQALLAIVEAQARAGDIAGARQTAAIIPGRPWQATLPIASALANAGDADGALESAEGIADKAGRTEAMVAVIKALAERGRLSLALADVNRRSLADGRDKALLAIVVVSASRSDFTGAIAAATRVGSFRAFSDAIIAVAAAEASAGNRSAAIETIDGYLTLVKEPPAGYSVAEAQLKALPVIAEALAKSGYFSQAILTAQSITDGGTRTDVYLAIAKSIASHRG